MIIGFISSPIIYSLYPYRLTFRKPLCRFFFPMLKTQWLQSGEFVDSGFPRDSEWVGGVWPRLCILTGTPDCLTQEVRGTMICRTKLRFLKVIFKALFTFIIWLVQSVWGRMGSNHYLENVWKKTGFCPGKLWYVLYWGQWFGPKDVSSAAVPWPYTYHYDYLQLQGNFSKLLSEFEEVNLFSTALYSADIITWIYIDQDSFDMCPFTQIVLFGFLLSSSRNL